MGLVVDVMRMMTVCMSVNVTVTVAETMTVHMTIRKRGEGECWRDGECSHPCKHGPRRERNGRRWKSARGERCITSVCMCIL